MSAPEKPAIKWPEAFTRAVEAFTKRPRTPLTFLYWMPIAVILASVVLVCFLRNATALLYVVPWVLGIGSIIVIGCLAFVAVVIWKGKTPQLQLGQVGPKQLVELQAQERLRQGDSRGNEYEETRHVGLKVEVTEQQLADIVTRLLAARQGGALPPQLSQTPMIDVNRNETDVSDVESADDAIADEGEDEN